MSILERIVNSESPYSANLPENELRIFKELHESGHISGRVSPRNLSAPDDKVENIQMTTSGRTWLDQLRKDKRESSTWFVTRRWMGRLFWLVLGIVLTLILKYIEKQLQL